MVVLRDQVSELVASPSVGDRSPDVEELLEVPGQGLVGVHVDGGLGVSQEDVNAVGVIGVEVRLKVGVNA